MIDRYTVRQEIQEILSGEVVTRLAIAESVVLGKVVDDLNGQGPIIAVLSGGSIRSPQVRGDKSSFKVAVEIWTPYQSAGGWTTAEAERRADLLEKAVGDMVEQRGSNQTYWRDLRYDQPSTPIDILVNEGHLYIFEVVMLGVKCGN